MNKKLIFFTLAAFLMSCKGGKVEKEDYKQTPHSVLTVKATGTSSTDDKQFTGIVKEYAEVSLGFKTAGQINHIYVKEGDHITKGQLLASIDSMDYHLGVEATQIQYDQLKDELARLKILLDGRGISANDYEKAESGLKQVAIQLQGNKNKVKYTMLYAPDNGIVESVNFSCAEMVNAGTPVFNIMSQGQMKIEVSVPVEIYENKEKILNIACQANGRNIPVSLMSITPKADATQLYKVLLAVDGGTTGISAGMNVSVVFNMVSAAHSSALTLPESAIFNESGKDYVWVVGKDSTITKHEIGLGGIDADGKMIVASGLVGTEEIVKSGVHSLVDKEKVRILPKQSKTNVGGLL